MPLHVGKLEALDMLKLAGDAGERRGDHLPREHDGEGGEGKERDAEADREPPRRRLDRPEELFLGKHGREHPVGEGERRQRHRVGLVVDDVAHGHGRVDAHVRPFQRMRERALGDRQQRLIGEVDRRCLIGLGVGHGDDAVLAGEDEGGAGAADGET